MHREGRSATQARRPPPLPPPPPPAAAVGKRHPCCSPKSFTTADAALCPAQPITEPPGWQPALQLYRPCRQHRQARSGRGQARVARTLAGAGLSGEAPVRHAASQNHRTNTHAPESSTERRGSPALACGAFNTSGGKEQEATRQRCRAWRACHTPATATAAAAAHLQGGSVGKAIIEAVAVVNVVDVAPGDPKVLLNLWGC